MSRVYQSCVGWLASAIFLPTQHFPVVSSLNTLSYRNLDTLIVFALSLFVVSTQIPWARRARRWILLLGVIYLIHVATAILEVRVLSAQELLQQQSLLVLLPGEFRVLERLKYLAYDLGLELGPYVLLVLVLIWNVSASASPPPGPSRKRSVAHECAADARALRRRLLIGSVAAVVAVAAVSGWLRWRESHPLHVAAHARLGTLYLQHGALQGAERQFRIAVAAGTPDPQVYLDLAALEARRGVIPSAAATLRLGMSVVRDSVGQGRIRDALRDLGVEVGREPVR
jgi:hypothetical protein